MNAPSAQSRAAELRRQWQEMEQAGSHLFPSQVAEQLRVNEAELLASKQSEGVTPLRVGWDRLLNALPLLGTVKIVTRNRSAVIEKDGMYPQYQHFSGHALFVGEAIDLRLSLGQWKFAFSGGKALW